MRLPELAIENHQFTIIIISLLIINGIAAYLNMPRSEDPQVSPAGSSVIVVIPGANPVDIEELAVDPIEEVLNELEDIKEIATSAENGLAVIHIEFLSGSDPDEKYSDVVQKVNSIRNELPPEMARFEIKKWSVSDVKIIQAAIISEDASYRDLEKEAERLKKEFERVPGIRQVEAWAYPEQEVRIAVDFDKISYYNISLTKVINAIQSRNANIPGGHLDILGRRFTIQSSGSYESIDEIKNTVVHAGRNQVVHLKDIADVDFDYQDITYKARFKDKRAVFISASQKENTNIYDIFEGLYEKMDAFKKELPGNMSLQIVFDQSESVSNRVNGFFSNLLQGLILVGLVVFFAVGLRASSIVILVIPISILIAIGLLDISDYGLQQMSIAGLVIALGLLVDNAIVVTENISRFMRLGYSPREAAVKGTQQVGWAIVSATLTTLLAFVPMIMMQNITGDFIRSMPLTVVFALSASLLISLTLTPYISEKFIQSDNEDKSKDSRFRKWLNRFIESTYRKWLLTALDRPGRIITAAVLLLIMAVAAFGLFVGVSFFPKAEKPQLMINIELPEGSSIARTDEAAQYVESVLRKKPEVRHYAANIGHGNPRIYYNSFTKNEKSNYAQIFVELYEYEPVTFSAFIDELRDTFSTYPGAKIEVKEFEQGPPVDAPIAIRIIGENLDELDRIAADVEQMIRTTDGVININNPLSTTKTDLHVRINEAKAGMLGVPIVEIDRAVRAAIAGLNVSKFRDASGKEYKIVIRLPMNKKADITDFDKIKVASYSGAQIPLKQLATVTFKSNPMRVNHYNLERNVMLTADVVRGVSVDEATQTIVEKLQQYDFAKGYRYYIGGELESREESFGGMFQAIMIAIIGIFAVLVLQFRSYSQPLIVFAAIPLAIVGSILALLITGYSFSFTAFVGLTSLIGIVINNSIILVDYTNQLRLEGKDMLSALRIAGETRFVPIILTTATTIGGLLPLTLRGGTLWAPMGWTIIGGLLLSTMLTLIVAPVLYKVFSPQELSAEQTEK